MVVFGAVIIAGIGFAGSYAAVRELALKKGFGNFAYVFPIGIDAGICVLLALDLLLTWIRIPFPLLRQTAWLLTVATIAFNGAAAWPDPLGVGMHAVIPVLFVVSVEAARHAIGRIADITADKHMEGVRLTRWLLSPIPTFLLWRRMKLWELRSYEQVIKLEQDRLVYQARLNSRFGRAWRRKAPIESLMPLRLARYGVPLAETAPAGLAAAGIEPVLLPPAPQLEAAPQPTAPAVVQNNQAPVREELPAPEPPQQAHAEEVAPEQQNPWLHSRDPQSIAYQGGYDPNFDPDTADTQWYEEQQAEQFDAQQQFQSQQQYEEPPAPEPSPEDTGTFPIPAGPSHTREMGAGGGTKPGEDDYPSDTEARASIPLTQEQAQPSPDSLQQRYLPRTAPSVSPPATGPATDEWYDYFHSAWHAHQHEHGVFPDANALAAYVSERDGITSGYGRPLTGSDLNTYVTAFAHHEKVHRGSSSAPETDHEQQQKDADKPSSSTAGPNEPTRGAEASATQQVAVPLADKEVTKVPRDTQEQGELTVPDRYYLAWMDYQTEHGHEPNAEQLSLYLAAQGLLGRGDKPVSPANLRRHLLRWRVYNIWAPLREHTDNPHSDEIAAKCATHGITGQYNKAVTTHYITTETPDFERRWQLLKRIKTMKTLHTKPPIR